MTKPASFYIGIKSVIVNVNLNKTLVLLKIDQLGRQYWDIPGGRINDGENPEDTLERELQEEIVNIGKNYTIKQFLSNFRLNRVLNDGNGLFLIFYKVETDLEFIELSLEHLSYKWVSLEDLSLLEQDSSTYIESGYLKALKQALE